MKPVGSDTCGSSPRLSRGIRSPGLGSPGAECVQVALRRSYLEPIHKRPWSSSRPTERCDTVTSETAPYVDSRTRTAPESELVRRAARVGRARRRPRRGDRVLLPRGRRRAAAVRLHDLARRPRLRRQPTWWPVPLLALSGLLVALTIRYLPGNSRAQARRGIQGGRPVPPIELPGHRPRRARHPQPRRRARPGGAADRDRQRPRRARGPPGQAGRARRWPAS